jgi:hypothetical protein
VYGRYRLYATMTADRFVHLRPLTPIEARVLYGLVAAWRNGHDKEHPAWRVVDSLCASVADAVDLQARLCEPLGPLVPVVEVGVGEDDEPAVGVADHPVAGQRHL